MSEQDKIVLIPYYAVSYETVFRHNKIWWKKINGLCAKTIENQPISYSMYPKDNIIVGVKRSDVSEYFTHFIIKENETT